MMNQEQAVHPRSFNGHARSRVDREMGTETEFKMHTGKPAFSNFDLVNGGNLDVGSSSRDRLVYVMASLIGRHVEVLVKNGSVISGIFHAANVEKDFGIILKGAQMIKDGSGTGQNPVYDAAMKPQTMIIPAREFVQVVAKDVSVGSDGFTYGHAQETLKDLMIDSAISDLHHLEVEKELERWAPDNDDLELPELDNIFDGTWNRNWNQFETNETLFGVKSTFDEELYTTKLDRGPHMRELEREALRIAREIEGEETHDRHLAEERCVLFDGDFDLDEESIYSAVRREVNDCRFEETDESFLDSCNIDTFGGSLSTVDNRSYVNISRKKVAVKAKPSYTFSSVDGETSSQTQALMNAHLSGSVDHASDASESLSDNTMRLDNKQISYQCEKKISPDEYTERTAFQEAQTSKFEAKEPTINLKGLSATATAYNPFGQENKYLSSVSSGSVASTRISVANDSENISLLPVSFTSSTRERVGIAPASKGSGSKGSGLSPSSSIGSLSSEKSTLNPYAKEFKFNANAKSFTPSAAGRAHTPVPEGSVYYAGNISAVPHVQNLPVSVGFGPSINGHHPVYNPLGAQLQSPQAYIPPNGPSYGQQMMIGQHRPVFYVPTYQPEMPYKGRNF